MQEQEHILKEPQSRQSSLQTDHVS